MPEEAQEPAIDEIDGPSTPLCPTCFHQADENWDFCPHCNAPLGATVGLDPIKRIYTIRFLFHRGVTRPNRPIILFGILLFCAIGIVPTFYLGTSHSASVLEILVTAAGAMFSAAIFAWSIYLVARNFLRADKEHD